MNKRLETLLEPTGYQFHLIRGDVDYILDSVKDFSSDEDKLTIESIYDTCDAMAYCSRHLGYPVYAFICNAEKGIIEGSTIAHEAYHLLNMVFDDIRYTHQDNDELEAYMLGRIFEQIEQFLND